MTRQPENTRFSFSIGALLAFTAIVAIHLAFQWFLPAVTLALFTAAIIPLVAIPIGLAAFAIGSTEKWDILRRLVSFYFFFIAFSYLTGLTLTTLQYIVQMFSA